MKRVLLALALVILSVAAPRAADVPVPPAPARWVTDTADFMRPEALRAADTMLEDFERTTGNQILVWIGNTTGDTPLEDWTIKAFEQWKVGRKGLDNGLILFVFAGDRKARIEVGYGLEGTVPDIVASRILNDVIIPKIRAGDKDGAILDGVNALRAAIAPGSGGPSGPVAPTGSARPETATAPSGSPAREPASCFEMAIVGVVVIGFLILLITNPSLALYLLFSILSGGRGGGGGGGGGGFSGGGGRGGGGGASGSW